MSDREKLIELLSGNACPDGRVGALLDCCGCRYENLDSCHAARYADLLIANGVTFATDINDSGKHGHWIIHSSGRGEYANNWAECSECHVCGSPQWKVCPVCEAKMDMEERE